MSRKIKNLKPSKGSRYKQGYFDVSRSVKYMNKSEPCIYRSSWEWKFCTWCENNKIVTHWVSEPFEIEYPCLVSGKIRHYNFDFAVHVDKPEKWLIEIKPSKEVNEAQQFGRILKNIVEPSAKKAYAQANQTAAKNYSKWIYAKKYCEDNGYRFVIVTEKWFNRI